MNYFDIIVTIPLVWSIYKGFKKGLVIEVASLAALVLGVYGGLNFSNYASDYIRNNFDISASLLPIVSFAITFLIIVILIFTLAKVLERVIKLVALGLVNRLMGAFFGFVKVTLICSILVYIVDSADYRYSFISNDFREESVLYEPLSSIAPRLMPLFTKWQAVDLIE